MNSDTLKAVLHAVSSGETTIDEALTALKHLSLEDIGYAHIDHHRSLRKGFPEVIFGENKTSDQIIGIMERMLQWEKIILVTRIDRDKADSVILKFPDAEIIIRGYGDTDKKYRHNMRLSQLRADIVKSYLIRHGTASARIKAFWIGSEKPTAENVPQEDRNKTHLVEIMFNRAIQ